MARPSLPNVISANRLELLQIADSYAREKSVDRETVFRAIEETVERSLRPRYGSQQDIRAQINPDTGEIRVFRHQEVVEEVDNPYTQLDLATARRQDPEAEIGSVLRTELPLAGLDRAGSQAGKQTMHKRMRAAERESQFEEFRDRVGDIITGTVKLVERGNVILDVQRGEAVMRRDQSIPRENFRIGDRVRALIIEVQNENPGPQVLLSRSSPHFMHKLFAQEVPEVYEGTIEFRGIARDPGSRAKIAVVSNNSSIDPVGACVGMRGSRVQTIVNELHGERIDVIPWSPDPEAFITSALQPARVVDVILDEAQKSAKVIVPPEDDNQSKAIGRRGQNVRLASKLTGWQISIIPEDEYSAMEATEREERIRLFMDRLQIDEQEAMILNSGGMRSLEDIEEAAPEDFSGLEGLDAARIQSIQETARACLDEEETARFAALRELGMEPELLEFLVECNFDIDHIEAIARHEDRSKREPVIRKLKHFADLTTDEICGDEVRVAGRTRRRVGILSRFNLPEEGIDTIVMHARVRAGFFTAEEVFGGGSAAKPADAPGEGEDGAEADPAEADLAEADPAEADPAEADLAEADGAEADLADADADLAEERDAAPADGPAD